MNTGKELLREIQRAEVKPGHYALWWFGQLGWVIKTASCLVGVDLFLSPHPKRRYPPLIKPEEAEGFDLFLGTHDHKDHVDREAWPAMAAASPKARFILPLRSLDEVDEATSIPRRRLVGLNDGMAITVGDLTIHAVPSAHEWIDNLPEAGGHRWLGYVLDTGREQGAVYHSGDTCIWEGMTERLTKWKIAAALLPINGRDAARYQNGVLGCMLYQEAGDLAARIRAGLVMPGHFDTFLRDELKTDDFVAYVESRYPDVKPVIPVKGMRVDI